LSLSRLIYKSIATAEVVSNETLRDLETRAAVANEATGITGLLILSGNVFVQVLEGKAADVTALFARIAADRRHRQVELITFDGIYERGFDDWHMRLVDLHDLPGDKRAFMSDKYKASEGRVVIPEDPCKVQALLLDARYLCISAPWNTGGGGADKASAATGA
jgi:hypothetical protein